MSKVAKINKVNLKVKEYNSERVVTFRDIDMLHKRKEDSTRRNFTNNKHKFIQNEDYYIISRKEFAELYLPANEPVIGNPNFDVVLLTEMGYLMIVKTFSDDLSWRVQRELVSSYFRLKEAPIEDRNEFDVMRDIIDMLEESKDMEDRMTIALDGMQKQIESLEARLHNQNEQLSFFPEPVVKNLVKASSIAHAMDLYTESGLPHSQMVGAIARKLGFTINARRFHEDDHTVIMKEGANRNALTWQVYYKPLAVKKITEWFNRNKARLYYEHRYKTNCKNGKAGDIRKSGFKIGGVEWAVSMN